MGQPTITFQGLPNSEGWAILPPKRSLKLTSLTSPYAMFRVQVLAELKLKCTPKDEENLRTYSAVFFESPGGSSDSHCSTWVAL